MEPPEMRQCLDEISHRYKFPTPSIVFVCSHKGPAFLPE